MQVTFKSVESVPFRAGARSLEFIEAAQSPENLLAHLLTLAHAMDDLEILIGTGTFESGKTLLAS